MYALYGFCRHADDIVDDLGDQPVAERAAALAALGDRLRSAFAGAWIDPAADPVVAAVARTVAVHRIDPECFERFLRSMTMDLTVDHYDTWDDLCGYMDGSAAVIGEMMLPILQPLDGAAVTPARHLGLAFQLTNFLRDVGEDLDRGRVYVPVADLERFGADPRARRVTPAWRDLMRFEIARNRALYASAGDRSRAPAAMVGARHRHRPHAVRPHPRRDRGERLRRVFPPGPRAHVPQAGRGGPRRPPALAPRGTSRKSAPRYALANDVHAAVACTPGAVAPPHAHSRPWKRA